MDETAPRPTPQADHPGLETVSSDELAALHQFIRKLADRAHTEGAACCSAPCCPGKAILEGLAETARAEPYGLAGMMAVTLRMLGDETAGRKRADVAEEIAQALDKYATNYPEQVFPSTSDSRDAIGGTAMRHAYGNAARIARDHAKGQ